MAAAAAAAAAAGNPLRGLQEEATCSICLEYYEDPVTAKCGHNFCRACIGVCFQGSASGLPCPQCREICPQGVLRPNRQLQSMVGLVRQLSVQAARGAPEEESLCEKHQEKLKLFCKQDQQLLCVICRESRGHRSHTALPVDAAAQEYTGELQEYLQPLRREMEDLLASKLREEERYKGLRKKMETQRLKTVAEFDGLRQLLKEQEQDLLRRLEEMERTIAVAENANISKLSSEISSMKALIDEIVRKCEQPAEELLKDIGSTLTRCQNVAESPRLISKKYKVLLTLDPDTAHGWLILSENGRRVARTEKKQHQLPHPKRFTGARSVLGKEGFSSGRHYWELQLLQDGLGWRVGVAHESVSRSNIATESAAVGFWTLGRWSNGQYSAFTSPYSQVHPHQPLAKLGVYLDYEGGRLSLYNADTMESLYTFTNCVFTERVYPYCRLWEQADLRLV
ncbi:E3 ubiquitin-protein ligase TRIM39-like [Ambystoma mexicanum]|uniref:E3 ubiquitin-protein ligase TRIM39-like n=1 Tax=Ambystoma mexicanum TaxID=8296 RepID=UPI0037E8795D